MAFYVNLPSRLADQGTKDMETDQQEHGTGNVESPTHLPRSTGTEVAADDQRDSDGAFQEKHKSSHRATLKTSRARKRKTNTSEQETKTRRTRTRTKRHQKCTCKNLT